MSDAQPLPARPDLDQYKKLAKDLQRAGTATDADAFRHCAVRWLEALAHARQVELTAEIRARIEREAHRMEQRWQKLLGRGRSRTRTREVRPAGHRKPDRFE